MPKAGAAVSVATRGAARRSERARESVRRPRARPGALRVGGPAAGLTTRAALLGLVVCALLVSAAVPMREFLAQRSRISDLQQAQAAQRERVAELEQRSRQLADPAWLTAQARERLHYVRPGETAYQVLVPPTGPAPVEQPGGDSGQGDTGQGDTGQGDPWYERWLDGVEDDGRDASP